jgi:hypothetical protein
VPSLLAGGDGPPGQLRDGGRTSMGMLTGGWQRLLPGWQFGAWAGRGVRESVVSGSRGTWRNLEMA